MGKLIRHIILRPNKNITEGNMAIIYLKFLISRTVGTLVDTVVLWILSTYVFTSYIGIYIVAPTISFEFAVISNFLFSYIWIWRRRIPVKNIKIFFSRFLAFNLTAVVGFVIKMSLLLLFARLFGWNVVYCNILALIISGIVNFILAEFVVFKKKPVIIESVNDREESEDTNN